MGDCPRCHLLLLLRRFGWVAPPQSCFLPSEEGFLPETSPVIFLQRCCLTRYVSPPCCVYLPVLSIDSTRFHQDQATSALPESHTQSRTVGSINRTDGTNNSFHWDEEYFFEQGSFLSFQRTKFPWWLTFQCSGSWIGDRIYVLFTCFGSLSRSPTSRQVCRWFKAQIDGWVMFQHILLAIHTVRCRTVAVVLLYDCGCSV